MKVRAWAALCMAAMLIAMPVIGQETTLIEFEIEDQFKKKHTDAEYRGSVLVLVAAGRKGSEYTGAWQEAVIDTLATATEADGPIFLGYADTRGAPFFVKGMIRGSFSQDPASPSLIDWKGTLAEAYQTDPDVATLLLFGRDGRLVTRVSGTAVGCQGQ